VAPERLDDAAGADAVTFTSSSAVERYVELVGRRRMPPIVACIGPITAATARDRGLAVSVEASVHTVDGLVDALVAALAPAVA
jgi:uroporphyrinogen III methyltransferase/synthase